MHASSPAPARAMRGTEAEPAIKGCDRDGEDGGHVQTRSATSRTVQSNPSVAMFPALFHRHAGDVEAKVTGRRWGEGEIGSPALTGRPPLARVHARQPRL